MKIFIIINFIIVLSGVANATIYSDMGKTMYYVSSSATGAGTGQDWTDAYTSLPSVLTRNSIYFIADGTYQPYVFNDAVSGSNYIYIVKATVSDHGTSTGWSDALGDGQAIWSTSNGSDPISIDSNYYIFDGKYRNGFTGDYGFKISIDSGLGYTIVKGVMLSTGIDNVSISYLDVQHRGISIPDVGDDCIYAAGVHDNITISHCRIRDASKNGIVLSGNDNIIDNCFFDNLKGAGSTHGQAIQTFSTSSNFTIKHNIFKNIDGTASIAMANGMDGLYIFGNVFYQPDNSFSTSPASIVDLSESNENGVINAFILNNTFIDYPASTGHCGIFINYTPDYTSNIFKNNLFLDAGSITITESNINHSANLFVNSTLAVGTTLKYGESVVSSSNDIPNKTSNDFRLSSSSPAINYGEVIDSTIQGLAVDYLGTTRAGNWDAGALEYSPPGTKYKLKSITQETP